MIITGVSAQWPTPKFWSRLQTADYRLQTANYRLPDIFRAAPICTRGDLGGSCKLANLRTAKSCCTTNITV